MKELKPKAKKNPKDLKRKVEISAEEYTEPKLPQRIKVVRTPILKSIIPGSVWRQQPFKYISEPFGVESERFKERIIDESIQDDSLLRWLSDPSDAIIYSVSGVPDDSKALYFATYLVEQHLNRVHNANVLWETIYGGFSNELLKKDLSIVRPSLLVISNLTPNSSSITLEKVRDILVKFSSIPRIVVSAGEDPISFVSARLHCPVNNIAYFQSSSVKQKISVI